MEKKKLTIWTAIGASGSAYPERSELTDSCLVSNQRTWGDSSTGNTYVFDSRCSMEEQDICMKES
jgi:hypothetical protein